MIMPSYINVNGIKVDIKLCKEVDEDPGLYGRFMHSHCRIEIVEELPEDQLIQSLWHELIHAIEAYYALKSLKDDTHEHYVDALGYALHATLKQNPQLVSLYK